MRLIGNDRVRGCSTDEVMVLVRHGVDVPVLSHDLNQPLTEETKPDIAMLGKEIVEFCGAVGVKKVRIDHSNRLRAVQTTAIVAQEFFPAGISVDLCETTGVREVYQGDFIIRDHVEGSEYKPLRDAWNVWQRKLDQGELLYRFGDPLVKTDGQAEHPELVGWFNQFGEHQGDFSLRLYLFLNEVFARSLDRLDLVVGHQASCSRIQRIISAIHLLKSADDFAPGEFVRILEKKGSRLTIDPACGVIVEKPNQQLALRVIQKEIEFLRRIV